MEEKKKSKVHAVITVNIYKKKSRELMAEGRCKAFEQRNSSLLLQRR